MPVRLRLLILFYRTKSTDINSKEFQINFTTTKLNIPFQFTTLPLFNRIHSIKHVVHLRFYFLTLKNMHKIEKAIENFIITIVWV